MSDVPWEALPPSEPLPARTFNEALLYLRVRGAAPLGARRREDRGRVLLEIRALHEGVEKRFAFRLLHLEDADEVHLGGGAPSALLDPADLVLFAARIAREAPTDPRSVDAVEARRWEHDLQLAAEAALEATKFVPQGAATPPESSFQTTAARWLFRKDPTRFSRASLADLENDLRRRAAEFQAAL